MSDIPASKTTILKKLAAAVTVCLVIPGLLLICLEIAAGYSPRAFPTSLFVKDTATDGSTVLRVNYQVGYRFFPGRLARKPLAEFMPTPKPAERLRIFVLGESAARGEQLADFSFARILQAFFNQNNPAKKVEVINTGIPAINSWVLREFAKEIVNYEPDLIIIYAGHNEFIGPYGPASVFGLTGNRTGILAAIMASSLKLVQLWRPDQSPEGLQQGWQGLEMFLRNKILSASQALQTCLNNWEQNLADIMQIAQQHKVPVVWCRVPVNLLDCAPFISDTNGLATGTIKAIDTLAAQIPITGLESAAKVIDELYRQAPKHALLNYLNGLVHYNRADFATAKSLLRTALAEDCFRVRINDSFNDAAGRVAHQHNAIIADVESDFSQNSRSGITGKDLIYDHVHLTQQGHYLVARCIYNSLLTTKLPITASMPQSFFDPAAAKSLTGFTGSDKIKNLEHIISSMSGLPFKLQFGHPDYMDSLRSELQKAVAGGNSFADQQAMITAQKQLPENAALSLRLAMLNLSQPENAKSFFLDSIRANPFNIDTLNNFGLLMLSNGAIDEAEKLFYQALRLAPDFARAHFNLGLCKNHKKDLKAAVKHYNEALKSDPSMAGAWRNLANLYFNEKNYPMALQVYERAARILPTDLMIHLGVGNCLMELQRVEEAAVSYKTTAASFTSSPLANYSLGLANSKLKKFTAAAAAFVDAGNSGYLQGYNKAIELHLSQEHSFSTGQFLEISQDACKLSDFQDPWLMQIYAAALLDSAKPDEALSVLHRARSLAYESGKQKLAQEIEANIKAIQQ